MAKMTVTCSDWRPLVKGSLRGFAIINIEVLGLVVHDVGLHSSHGKYWAALPARPWINGGEVVTDDNGIKYAQLLEFPRKEIRDAFSQRVVCRFDPSALALEETAP